MSRDEISGRAINGARPCTNARGLDGLEGDKLGNEKRNQELWTTQWKVERKSHRFVCSSNDDLSLDPFVTSAEYTPSIGVIVC